jgi:hypothetical protein
MGKNRDGIENGSKWDFRTGALHSGPPSGDPTAAPHSSTPWGGNRGHAGDISLLQRGADVV